jgi:hypothetical protein
MPRAYEGLRLSLFASKRNHFSFRYKATPALREHLSMVFSIPRAILCSAGTSIATGCKALESFPKANLEMR